MNTKDTLTRLAEQARQDFWEKGEVVLQSPVLVQAAECARNLVFGLILSRSVILSDYAPFALGWIGAAGSGFSGFAALLGAASGYLLGLGLVDGLRYVAAGILVYATAFALYDLRIYRKVWFVPLATAAMTAVTGFIYLSESGWEGLAVACFLSEVVLAGVSCFCYQQLPTLWEETEEPPVAERLFLLATIAVALAPLEWGFGLSPGVMLACFCLLPTVPDYRPGAGAGFGLALDLAMSTGGVYTCAFTAGALLSLWGQGRGKAIQAGLFLAASLASVAWFGGRVQDVGSLLAGSVLYLATPNQVEEWIRKRLGKRVAIATGAMTASDSVRQQVGQQLHERAEVFRQLSQQLEGQLKEEPAEYAGAVFDRTAERVCKGCALRQMCWKRDYRATYQALNGALKRMEERGFCQEKDFQEPFYGRCMRLRVFVNTANEELYAWRSRRRFRVQLMQSKELFCRQFSQTSRLLQETAAELGGEWMADSNGITAVKRVLRSSGVNAAVAVQRNSQGRRVIELTGQELSQLAAAEGRRRLSHAMGVPLESGELTRTTQGQRLRFRESPRLAARVGAAARPRDGESVSGDNGSWFKDGKGCLWVVLCDGMGVGSGAAAESRLVLRLLESFLKSGVTAETALNTLAGALTMRTDSGFRFSTIDLLQVDLFSGEGAVYKMGAAPSYFRHSGIVSRITTSALPAGLSLEPEGQIALTRFQVAPGDLLVLVTDGVSDGGEDDWIQEKAEQFSGESPRELALALLEDKRSRRDDDRTAVVILLGCREESDWTATTA